MAHKKYKSIRYRRPPPTNREVLDWASEHWNVLQYWENVYILNPETKNCKNISWDQFNCKQADILIETPGRLRICETDPTVLMQTGFQLQVYHWYMTNKKYIESLRDRRMPSSKQTFFHPDIIPIHEKVEMWAFVRETDSMLQRVCDDPRFDIKVVEIPL